MSKWLLGIIIQLVFRHIQIGKVRLQEKKLGPGSFEEVIGDARCSQGTEVGRIIINLVQRIINMEQSQAGIQDSSFCIAILVGQFPVVDGTFQAISRTDLSGQGQQIHNQDQYQNTTFHFLKDIQKPRTAWSALVKKSTCNTWSYKYGYDINLSVDPPWGSKLYGIYIKGYGMKRKTGEKKSRFKK